MWSDLMHMCENFSTKHTQNHQIVDSLLKEVDKRNDIIKQLNIQMN